MGKELGRTVGGKLPFACWCVGMLLCECSLRFCSVPGTALGPGTGGDLGVDQLFSSLEGR